MDTYSIKRADEIDVVEMDGGCLHWYASAEKGNSAAQTLGRCILYPGGSNPVHFHPNCEEILHVLSGEIEHYIEGDGWIKMGPGDTITLPVDVPHQARNTGTEDAHMIICFSDGDRKTVGKK